MFIDIPNYEGYYKISNIGNIISLDRAIPFRNGYKSIKGGLIKPSICNRYKSVSLNKNSVSKTFNVHQLVAISFLGHKKQGHKLVIDHIDGDKLNNSVDNLQIISQRDNFHKGGRVNKIRGVWFEKSRNKWRASISIEGKQKILGRFKTKEEAESVYKEKLKSINEY